MRSEYALDVEMEHVLAALMPANRLVMQVALRTGLRVSDVLALRRDQIKKGRFTVVEKKTGKRRRVSLPAVLVSDLLDNEKGRKSEWVFPGGRNPAVPRTRQAVWADVKHAAKAFRLPQNVTPHSARKIYAVSLMRKYGDIDKVRSVLGHDRAETTMLYAMADTLLTSRKRYDKVKERKRKKGD